MTDRSFQPDPGDDHPAAAQRDGDRSAADGHAADRATALRAVPNERPGRASTSAERQRAFAYMEVRHQDWCGRLRGFRCDCMPELVARWKSTSTPA